MKHFLTCRRTFIGLVGLGLLFMLGYNRGAEVAASMTTIVIGIAAANAYQGVKLGTDKTK